MSVFDDDRFKHILTDPKFQGVPKKERKVIIDKRFQSMFTDKKFQLNYSVDKRGRPINHSHVEDYHNFYQLESDSESSDNEDEEKRDNVSVSKGSDNENADEQSESVAADLDGGVNCEKVEKQKDEYQSFDDIAEEKQRKIQLKREQKKEQLKKDTEIVDEFERSKITDETRERLLDMAVDYARGGANLFTDSSSDEITSSDSEEEIVHDWGELDRDAEKTEEATSRLAACNMDWDRVCAKDLMVLFNSFVPAGGIIRSVKIFPSEFGLARMKEEDLKGPTELVNLKESNDSDSDSDLDTSEKKRDDEEEVSEENMEKLREYQLKRLKYFYAVIEFDCAETANKVYTECDGMEYESSATKLDLRFIPDDMKFDQEPKEICSELPEGGKYLPRVFANSALQQGTVRLTWDETDPDRLDVVRKAATGQLDEERAKAYVALSSDDEDADETSGSECAEESIEGEENTSFIGKYRTLLTEIQKKEEEKRKGKIEMEITWDLNAANSAQEKEAKAKDESLTPFERIIKKRRDKRKERQKKKDDNLFSDDDIPSDVDLNDPFFKDELGPDIKKKAKSKDSESKKEKPENKESQQEKAELDLLFTEDAAEDMEKKHFSLKGIQKLESTNSKKKKRKNKYDEVAEEDNFKINLKDERFGALFSSHHYNVDPADSHFRKTKAMEEIINEKIKRRKLQDEQKEPTTEFTVQKKSSDLSPQLSMLVKSVKNKIKNS